MNTELLSDYAKIYFMLIQLENPNVQERKTAMHLGKLIETHAEYITAYLRKEIDNESGDPEADQRSPNPSKNG